jgi:predicted aspartyl protease/Flp pilus assembly protein TadD
MAAAGIAVNPVTQSLSRSVCFFVAVFCLLSRCVSAEQCGVLRHDPPSDADKAFLAADYAKAESLYRTALATNPSAVQLTLGLVHALLRDQKVQEAAGTVQAALASAPGSAALITLRGEVEYRQGEPWTAAQSAEESFKLDPCNPRTELLLADLFRMNSLYASARAHLMIAHQLDPQDPEIREEWMMALPLKERIPEVEAYLGEPRGDDAEELRSLHEYLEHIKKVASEPRRDCRLVSNTTATEIPFVYVMRDANHIEGFGLDVKLNNHDSTLEIDTGASGLLVTSSIAKHAGLKVFSQTEVLGVGDEGIKNGYTAYADSIRIGNLEFQNCPVRVVDSRNMPGDEDGLIGMDVLSRFLVTLDYPARKLSLGPLPPRPGEEAAVAPQLNTDDEDEEGGGPVAAPPGDPGSAASHPGAAVANAASHGPYNRYIAPEMSDYTKVYRVGNQMIVPAALNASKIKLFILDTGAWTTIISPEAAREVTKVHGGAPLNVEGLNGEVNKLYLADQITFRFAQLSQKVEGVVAFDTSKISKAEGMEISGFLGATTLDQLTIHIDYRDGLVKFDYDAKRNNHF